MATVFREYILTRNSPHTKILRDGNKWRGKFCGEIHWDGRRKTVWKIIVIFPTPLTIYNRKLNGKIMLNVEYVWHLKIYFPRRVATSTVKWMIEPGRNKWRLITLVQSVAVEGAGCRGPRCGAGARGKEMQPGGMIRRTKWMMTLQTYEKYTYIFQEMDGWCWAKYYYRNFKIGNSAVKKPLQGHSTYLVTLCR